MGPHKIRSGRDKTPDEATHLLLRQTKHFVSFLAFFIFLLLKFGLGNKLKKTDEGKKMFVSNVFTTFVRHFVYSFNLSIHFRFIRLFRLNPQCYHLEIFQEYSYDANNHEKGFF